MKSVVAFTIKAVNFIFNLILPADSDMSDFQELCADEVFNKLQKVHTQKYSGVFAIFSYKDKLVRKMIWQMKFRECHWVSELFAQFLCEKILRTIASDKRMKEIFLVPIPLHHKRLAERGYNQCEWLCDGILKNIQRAKIVDVQATQRIIYHKNILKRTKYRTKQSWSSRAERLRNSQNIFAVSNISQVSGRDFILIDDVVTTGATLNEARRTLLAAGASSVICFVIAH